MNAARRPAENTPLVLVIAIALWAASTALGGALGAFTNLGPRLGASLITFATAFAVATYYLDRGVRATVDAVDARTLAVFAAAGLAAIAWIFLEGASLDALTRMPRILVPLFVAPVTIAMNVALLDRLFRAQPRADALSSEAHKPRGNHATAV